MQSVPITINVVSSNPTQEVYSIQHYVIKLPPWQYNLMILNFHMDFSGYDMYFHTGSFYGFTSVVGLIPSKNIGVYLNANGLGEAGFRNTMKTES
jgi:hypothetical protein